MNRALLVAFAVMTAVSARTAVAAACTTEDGRCGTQTCGRVCEFIDGVRVCYNTCSECVPNTEVCNGIDDDCFGGVDDGFYKCSVGTFEPLNCSESTYTVVPYNFDANHFDGRQIPRSAHNAEHYATKIHYEWSIFMNRFVKDITLTYGPFETDSPFDRLIVRRGPGGGILESLHGSFPQSFTAPFMPRNYVVSGTGQAEGLDMWFISDESVTGLGFDIREAAVLCGSSGSATVPTIRQSKRADGLLLGTNDVVFFQFPGGPEPIRVLVEGIGDLDVDVYARLGAVPTKNTYTHRSATTGNHELLRIPGGSTNQPVFVAVTSAPASGKSGRGSFRLRMMRAKEERPQTVGFNWYASGVSPTATELSRARNTMRTAMKRFMGLTEGQVIVPYVRLHAEPPDFAGNCRCNGGKCDVCIKSSTSGRPFCFPPNSTVELFSNWGMDSPTTVAHEWGHCILGLPDEYGDHYSAPGAYCGHSDFWCPHSTMSSSFARNLCTPLNHIDSAMWKSDNHVCWESWFAACNAPCAVSPNSATEWEESSWGRLYLSGRVVHLESDTPDHDDYAASQWDQYFPVYGP